MPPRTSAPRHRIAASPLASRRPVPLTISQDTRESIAHHGSSITILWVLMVCMSIAVWMVLLVTMIRLDQLEATIASSFRQQIALQEVTTSSPDSVAAVAAQPTATSSLVATAIVSSSGALDRGTMSVDGTRYAGYDDLTKGKIGIGVEIIATKQVKHIVLFDTRSEATGQGTPSEGEMSVRWKDAKTVEYDVLVKKGAEWVKETQSVKIFF